MNYRVELWLVIMISYNKSYWCSQVLEQRNTLSRPPWPVLRKPRVDRKCSRFRRVTYAKTQYGCSTSHAYLTALFVKVVLFALLYLVTGNNAAGYYCLYTYSCDKFTAFYNFTAILKPSVVCAFRPSTFTFTCMTDTGALLWVQSWAKGTIQIMPPYSDSSVVNESRSLGFFTTRLDSMEGNILISTATTNSTLLQNITTTTTITLICDDTGDAISDVNATLIIMSGMC